MAETMRLQALTALQLRYLERERDTLTIEALRESIAVAYSILGDQLLAARDFKGQGALWRAAQHGHAPGSLSWMGAKSWLRGAPSSGAK
jgi:hypothetical protein